MMDFADTSAAYVAFVRALLAALAVHAPGSHRFIYRYHAGRIEVFFAEERKLVYELLAAHLARFFEAP